MYSHEFCFEDIWRPRSLVAIFYFLVFVIYSISYNFSLFKNHHLSFEVLEMNHLYNNNVVM